MNGIWDFSVHTEKGVIQVLRYAQKKKTCLLADVLSRVDVNVPIKFIFKKNTNTMKWNF